MNTRQATRYASVALAMGDDADEVDQQEQELADGDDDHPTKGWSRSVDGRGVCLARCFWVSLGILLTAAVVLALALGSNYDLAAWGQLHLRSDLASDRTRTSNTTTALPLELKMSAIHAPASTSDHNFDAAHLAITRVLGTGVNSSGGGAMPARPSSSPRALQHGGPVATSSLATGGRRSRSTTGQSGTFTFEHAPSASASPVVPPTHESLPYHRKRMLEMIDPSTYSAVLSDTARQLGVDLAAQPSKRWVVEALFLAPLPQDVLRCYDDAGHAYYHDTRTGISSWLHPCADQFQTLLKQQPDAPVPAQAEAKSNDYDDHDSAIESRGQTPLPADGNNPSGHTRRFMRANAGLSSTSSLFLSEAELAAWDGAATGLGEDDHGNEEQTSDADDEWIEDEFGGRDGERWAGENGDDVPSYPRPPRGPPSAGRRSSAPRRASSRPSSSYTFPPPVLPPGTTNAVPWNSAQPAAYHAWRNPAGIADTEHIVQQPGSLIAERARSRPQSGVAGSQQQPNNGRFSMRPLSGLVAPPPVPMHSTDPAAASRASQSSAVKAGHKLQRARINGQLRETSSHLYTIRATLLTKLKSLQRIIDRVENEDERAWAQLHRAAQRFAEVTSERQGMFAQAASMLHGSDAQVLEDTLARTLHEVHASCDRIGAHRSGCRALVAQVASLQDQLRLQADRTGEVLKMDTACLELAKTGALPMDMPSSAPSTSLADVQALLNRVLEFQALTRHGHSSASARQLREKALLDHLHRSNALVLRRGGQHCSERKSGLLTELLANKALIPSLHNQAKSLKQQLQQQMGPLQVCQRTYELRTGRGYNPHYHQQQAAHGGDEHTQLLRSLEDELSSLSTLVAHLESELALTQSQLRACLETAALKKADLSAEDVRTKFYRAALQLTDPQPQQPQPLSSSLRAHSHQHHQQHQQHQQDHVGYFDAPSVTGAPHSAHHRAHTHSPDRSSSAPSYPVPVHRPAVLDDGPAYRGDPTRVGTYLHSFDMDGPDHPPAPPAPPQQQRPDPYAAPLGGSGGGRRASRPGSAALHASQQVHGSLVQERAQLVRDSAANLERLRTRKVRRAQVAAGAHLKPERLVPPAGRPVFEGRHSTGYDS